MKNFNQQLHYMVSALLFMAATLLSGCDSDSIEVPSPYEASLKTAESSLQMKADQNKLIAGIRAATAKYHRVEAAIADGYVLPEDFCVSNPYGEGAMGYHYINMNLIDPVVEPFKPEVLVYEKKKNGQLSLVAVEYIKLKEPDDENVPVEIPEEAPYLGSQQFDETAAPHLPANFTLHVWLWKNNPDGMYAPFNTNVTCQN